MNVATERWLVRRRAWMLLSEVLVRSPSAERLAQLHEVLALPREVDAAFAEQLAVEHHALFELEAPPCSCPFLDDLEGREHATMLGDRLAEQRFEAPPSVSADHLAAATGLAARAGALEAERAVVTEMILPWLPAYLVAIADLPASRVGRVWPGTVEVVFGLAIDAAAGALPGPRPAVRGLGERTHDEGLDLERVAETLTRPSTCGVMCTSFDIVDIGRKLSVPVGFGSRRQRMEGLLRGGGRFDRVGEVLSAIDELLTRRHQAMGALPLPDDAVSWIAPWTERIESTRRALSEMSAESLVSLEADQ